jgi:hypothetical protein
MNTTVPKEYANATHYFSESQKEWVSVLDLPLPHVLNIYKKHYLNDGFTGSPLATTLAQRLMPTRAVAKSLLATKGECAYFCPPKSPDTGHDKAVRVRRFFYSIGKALGVKITTERQGDFIKATADRIVGEEVNVRIKHKNRFRGGR